MNKTGIPYLDFTWNPGGCGCTNGCPTCWARGKVAERVGRNIGCDDCKNFRVHWHPERLGQLAKRKKPAVIGVQFTGDLFDDQQVAVNVGDALRACWDAPQHTYVFLTQRPVNMARFMNGIFGEDDGPPDNWYIGATIKQACPKAQEDLAALLSIRSNNLWISHEPSQGLLPLAGTVHAAQGRLKLIVVGADNDVRQPREVEWLRYAASAANEKTDFPPPAIYVKQMWLWNCPNCDRLFEPGEVNGVTENCPCGTAAMDLRLTLATATEDFPADLARQELPWTLTTKGDGRKAKGEI